MAIQNNGGGKAGRLFVKALRISKKTYKIKVVEPCPSVCAPGGMVIVNTGLYNRRLRWTIYSEFTPSCKTLEERVNYG